MKVGYVKISMTLVAVFLQFIVLGKQPPADISSDAATYEENLLTKPQRDQLLVEMINLQRDILAANREIDLLPAVKAAKDELLALRKANAPRKDIVAANTKYIKLKEAEQSKDVLLSKKLERYKYVASLLEYDKLRNKVNRAKLTPEALAEARPEVQLAKPAYDVIVEKEEQLKQEQSKGGETPLDNLIPENVVKLMSDNRVWVDGKLVAWDDLSASLKLLYEKKPELELEVDGEVDTPISKLMEIIKLARAAGFKNVSIRKLF